MISAFCSRFHWTAVLLFTLAGLAVAPARELTAFELIPEANRYVGEHARDKVVRMYSEKSIGGLVPSVWQVVYYDSTATLKATRVKFGGGKMLEVKRPMNLLEPFTGPASPMDRDKLQIDSDKALRLAMDEPLLKHVTLKASALELKSTATDGLVWVVELWAAKAGHPDLNTSVGKVRISATSGKIIQRDLHIERVN